MTAIVIISLLLVLIIEFWLIYTKYKSIRQYNVNKDVSFDKLLEYADQCRRMADAYELFKDEFPDEYEHFKYMAEYYAEKIRNYKKQI